MMMYAHDKYYVLQHKLVAITVTAMDRNMNYDLQQKDRLRRLFNLAGVQFLRLVRRVMSEGSSVNQRSSRASVSLRLGQLGLPDV